MALLPQLGATGATSLLFDIAKSGRLHLDNDFEGAMVLTDLISCDRIVYPSDHARELALHFRECGHEA